MTVTLAHTGRLVEPRLPTDERPSIFPKGRRCALGACGCPEGPVVLSIYNDDETCSVCTPKLERLAHRAAARQ